MVTHQTIEENRIEMDTFLLNSSDRFAQQIIDGSHAGEPLILDLYCRYITFVFFVQQNMARNF